MNPNNIEFNVCAVLVTYRPKPDLLKKVIKSLEHQVHGMVIVDNSATNQDWKFKKLKGCHIHKIRLGANMGVAVAQNKGIKWARENGFSHVLLMDQDSVPDRNMIFYLTRTMLGIEKKGKRVAAAGPKCYNSGYNSFEPFLIRKHHWIKRVKCKKSSNCFPVEFLISSGSLIPIKTIDIVGGMSEALFVDYIDVEWGLRALSKGYDCYAACQGTITHHLGEVIEKKILFMHRKIVKHPPERYYYQFRNVIFLFKKPYVPFSWVIYHTFRQLVPRFFLQALLIPPRRLNIMMMITGLYHGFCGITGPYANQASR